MCELSDEQRQLPAFAVIIESTPAAVTAIAAALLIAATAATAAAVA